MLFIKDKKRKSAEDNSTRFFRHIAADYTEYLNVRYQDQPRRIRKMIIDDAISDLRESEEFADITENIITSMQSLRQYIRYLRHKNYLEDYQ